MSTDLLLNYLDSLHKEYLQLDEGEVATYIPELAKANPDWFGIAIVTVDGHVYQVGETKQSFTIQSISKVITYGIGLEDSGVDAVLKKIDVEPSGEAFNQISLEPNTGRPRNPMINAGAIASVAFVEGETMEDKLARILSTYRNFLGHEASIDQAVYQSEKSTGHRNRAIANMLRNYDIIERDTDDLLDLYFKQCSILVNCRDLAMIAASLANNGVNPITGVRGLQREYVPKLLSVMSSCGMYDFSGAWVYEVGMPAKSGVAGGVMAVLPGQLGIAVFSPKLDKSGNSVRGIAVCKRISSDFGLHMFHAGRTTATSVIHSSYDASAVTSKRSRNVKQTKMLNDEGHRIRVLELQGDLMFASAEIVVSASIQEAATADYFIVDFRRIASITEGAMNLLSYLVEHMDNSHKTILFTNIRDPHNLTTVIRKKVPHIRKLPLLKHNDIDAALEWCEEQVLNGISTSEREEVALSEQAFCAGFTEEELLHLENLLEPLTFEKDTCICRAGEPANELYFIISGQVSVTVSVDFRRDGRITSLAAGSAFGEMGLLDHGLRSANVIADTHLSCLRLRYSALKEETSEMGRNIQLKLISNIGRALTLKLRQATTEIQSLKS